MTSKTTAIVLVVIAVIYAVIVIIALIRAKSSIDNSNINEKASGTAKKEV